MVVLQRSLEDERSEPGDGGELLVGPPGVDHDPVAHGEPFVGTGHEVEILERRDLDTVGHRRPRPSVLTLCGSRCSAPSSNTPAAEGVSAEVRAEPPITSGS